MARHKTFSKTCPLLAGSFLNFSSVFLAGILLAQKISATQGQDEQLNFLDSKLVGSITAPDLNAIIEKSQGATPKQKDIMFETIFQTFPRLLYSYENTGQTKSTLLELLDIAPITNAKIQYTNGTTESEGVQQELIEVWISFSPQQGDKTQIIQDIIDAVTQTNSKFNNTVTTLLLNYSGQNVSGILPEMKQEIRTISEHVKNESKYTLALGVILDMVNCEEHVDEIDQSMDMVDIVFFKGSKTISPPSDSENETCGGDYDTRLSMGFITPWPVSIYQDSSMLEMSLENKSVIIDSYDSWQQSYNVTLILEANLRYKDRPSNDSSSSNKGKTANTTSAEVSAWLEKPVVLSKDVFGMSIVDTVLNRDNFTQSRFISVLYENTRRIIIGDVSATTKDLRNKTQLFIRKMAELKRNIVRNKSATGGSNIFDDQLPMRVHISVLISHENVDTSEKDIDKASYIAMKGNDVFPLTVTGITLNCWDYPVEQNAIIGENKTTENYWQTFIAPRISYVNEAAKKLKESELEVGIILPDQFCKNFTSLEGSYLNLEMLDVIVFKREIEMSEINAGVRELVAQLAVNFQQCRRNAERLEERKRTRVEFLVKPTGCGTNYSDVHGLLNLVRLWEGMNSFAMNEKIEVTMDTAFEDENESGVEHCGWWKIIPEKGNVTFENKKSTASKLYKKLYPNAAASESGGSGNTLLLIILPTTLFVLFLCATAAHFVVRYRSKYVIGLEEADDFFKGMDDKDKALDESSPLNLAKDDGNRTAHSQAYDKERLEISKENFTLDTKRSLGAGEFGMVCRGSVKKQNEGEDEKEVAVKMINDRQGSREGCARALRGLMSEIKILSYVGDHKHIISLEGAYTAELRRGKIYVFLELCQMGSLDKHLRSFEPEKEKTIVEEDDDNYGISVPQLILDDALAKDLFQWSKEICCGMEYLASKNVVHADLATRNVLLNSNKCAKIADFGLSRRLYDYTNYVKKQQEPMPWRWMAPESLRRLEFNEKTDVWAFGVTLWEIYSLGDGPYPGLSWDVNFVSYLERGVRLSEPRYKEDDMFKVMQTCWESDAASRPSFSELLNTLNSNQTYAKEIPPE